MGRYITMVIITRELCKNASNCFRTFPCHIRDLEFPTFAQVGMREELQKLRKDHAERVQELQGAAEETVVIPTQFCKDQMNEIQ